MSASPAVALSARASAGLPGCVCGLRPLAGSGLSNWGCGFTSLHWFQPFRLSFEALKLVLASKVVCVGLCPRASAGLLGCALGPGVDASLCGCGFGPWGWCWFLKLGLGL